MSSKRITTSGVRPPGERIVACTSAFLTNVTRYPGTWALTGVAGLAWSVHKALAGIHITSTTHYYSTTYNYLAFLCSLVASGLGLTVLARTRWTRALLSRRERALTEILGLALLAVIGLAIPIAAGSRAVGLASLAHVALHLACLAWLVSKLPTSPGLHPWLLVTLVLGFPALAQGRPALEALAHFLLGPVSRLGQEIQTRSFAAADMAPTVAFGLTAGLLTPRIPRA